MGINGLLCLTSLSLMLLLSLALAGFAGKEIEKRRRKIMFLSMIAQVRGLRICSLFWIWKAQWWLLPFSLLRLLLHIWSEQYSISIIPMNIICPMTPSSPSPEKQLGNCFGTSFGSCLESFQAWSELETSEIIGPNLEYWGVAQALCWAGDWTVSLLHTALIVCLCVGVCKAS